MATTTSQLIDAPAEMSFVCGGAPAIQKVNALVGEIARTSIPVLVVGESGTGKEVYGRLIHRLSKGGGRPLRKFNCRALEPGELLAQLKADTHSNTAGFEHELQTLFLDDVDELDLGCQNVLLASLPDGDVGEEGQTGARLIASAAKNLDREIEAGRFRRELYFRINGACLRLPPLRERKEDVGAFMEHFLKKHSHIQSRQAPLLTTEEALALESYDWPGNIREVENLAKSAVALGCISAAMETLRSNRLADQRGNGGASWSLKAVARAASREAERKLILTALERTRWNRKRAARELQISYKSLLYKIKQTGIDEAKPGGQ